MGDRPELREFRPARENHPVPGVDHCDGPDDRGAAGLQTLVLTPGITEAAMRAAARRHDVSVAYLSAFRMPSGDGSDGGADGSSVDGASDAPHGIVVGYSTPADHAFTPALDALVSAIRSAAG